MGAAILADSLEALAIRSREDCGIQIEVTNRSSEGLEEFRVTLWGRRGAGVFAIACLLVRTALWHVPKHIGRNPARSRKKTTCRVCR